MIKSLVIKGLWGRYDYDLQFNEDVNIFTGSNGTGKTTLLKMLWYAYSGNFKQLLLEIPFRGLYFKDFNDTEIMIEVTSFPTKLFNKRDLYKFEITNSLKGIALKESGNFIDGRLFPSNEGDYSSILEEYSAGNDLTSYFFPTFRRLEGGYSLDENTNLKNILRDFVGRISKGHHQFITTSDASDIRAIVNEISSDIGLKQEAINAEFMDFIKRQLGKNLPEFEKELKANMQKKGQAEAQAKEPIDNLSRYVDQFFWEKSVKISENLKLGQHENEIEIENLSAGEKNLLSFLVYATSMKEGVMFIDEPELNLHIEWQRELVATLRDIAPNVQLFMASHSPAIYAGYDDKSPWFNDLIRHTTSTSNEPALVE